MESFFVPMLADSGKVRVIQNAASPVLTPLRSKRRPPEFQGFSVWNAWFVLLVPKSTGVVSSSKSLTLRGRDESTLLTTKVFGLPILSAGRDSVIGLPVVWVIPVITSAIVRAGSRPDFLSHRYHRGSSLCVPPGSALTESFEIHPAWRNPNLPDSNSPRAV